MSEHRVPRSRPAPRDAARRPPEAARQRQGEDLRFPALPLSEHELLGAVIAGSPVALYVVDASGVVALWNPAAERLYGWRSVEAVGRRLPIVDEDSAAEFERLLRRTLGGRRVLDVRTRRRHRDGRLVDVAISTVPLRDGSGRISGVLGVSRDLSDYTAAQGELVRQAAHDDLTGLYSRRAFLEQVQGALPQMAPSAGILHLDIDDFHTVNDAHGHPTGDRLLRAVATRLSHTLRSSDVVARLGGDEFAALLPHVTPAELAAQVSDVFERLRAHFVVDGHHLAISFSGGVVLGGPTDMAAELIRQADVALSRAKRLSRGGFQVFDAAMHRAFTERVELSTRLARAAERGELVLHYQPIASVATGEVTGVEALVRWAHPERGLLAPDAFIPLAEETGSIGSIGGWVLRAACAALQGWTGTSPQAAALTVSVNISAIQLQDPNWADSVLAALRQSRLDPSRLELEVTESALSADPGAAAAILGRLRQMGVRLAIDDFGTGHSSLTALRRYPFTSLKIDRSFVGGIHTGSDDNAIVAASLALARTIGLTTIAEGVETQEQLDFLARNGCDALQGYYLSPPVPADAIPALLADRRLSPTPAPAASAPVPGAPGPGSLFQRALRPILEELLARSDLEAVYLTHIDWARGEQRVLSSTSGGDLVVPEGLVVAWSDTLCRRSLAAGRRWVDDVPTTWPESAAGRALGIVTYASLPVVLSTGEVFGTLCGASPRPVPEDATTLSLLRMAARVAAVLAEGPAPTGPPAAA